MCMHSKHHTKFDIVGMEIPILILVACVAHLASYDPAYLHYLGLYWIYISASMVIICLVGPGKTIIIWLEIST